MALFSGSGDFTLVSGKINDIRFETSGAVTLGADARGLSGDSDIEMDGGSLMDSDLDGHLLVSGDTVRVDNVECETVEISGAGCVVNLHSISPGGVGVTVSGDDNRVRGRVVLADQHGVLISGNDNDVEMTVAESGVDTTNTYDNIQITGNTNKVMGCKLTPQSGNTTRYGINVASGSNNVVHANFLGDSSAYGTADSVDNGTATLTTPDDGVIGGQFAY